MSLRSFVALAILAVQLCGCAAEPRNKGAIDEMDRRHNEEMQRTGGGGSM
jgi:hypothetical protein